MMKKILAAAACAVMVLSLAACGKNKNPPANQTQPFAGNTVSTPNNGTPDSPGGIDWRTVPYANEKDFKFEELDGFSITQYLGNDTVINIPPTIYGKKVVRIGEFYDKPYDAIAVFGKDVTNVNIPNGVTEIGSYAFDGCESLKSITIPDSVTLIGYAAFKNCTSLTSITIPDGVKSIGGFEGCTSLTSITIPDGVTKIGLGAFKGCTSLTSITIPDSVTRIEPWAFENCTSLKRIMIPDGVTEISEKAFKGCESLKSITIPDGVTEILPWTFEGCTSLKSITIPDSVNSIMFDAFKDCPNVKVTYNDKVYDYAHINDIYTATNGN